MDRRGEILTAAGCLFREHGYHATSMRDIAKHMGMRGSSLYAHVTSKEEMLWELVSRAADAFLRQARSVAGDLPPRQRLKVLIRGHLTVIVQELPNATVFFHEWKFLSDEHRARVIAWRDAYENTFRDAIADGKRQGAFDVADVKVAAIYILSALNWTYQWYRVQGELSLDALIDHYTQLSWRVVGAEEES